MSRIMSGFLVLCAALALALALPQTAGGRVTPKMTITEIALSGEHYEILNVPDGKVLGVTVNADGLPILSVMHEVGTPTQERSVWLLWAGERWQDLGPDLLVAGAPFLYQGHLRYPFLRKLEPWPPALTPEMGQPQSQPPILQGPPARGDEPPFLEKP